MAPQSGRFRKTKTSYATVSNYALRDKTLSLKAKGLLGIIESYLSLENFTLYKTFLLNISTDGETSFRGAWTELKTHGYLIQYKLKDEKTKQFYYEYEICDRPLKITNEKPQGENQHVAQDRLHVENPHVGIQDVGSPHVDNLLNGNSTCVKPPLFNNTVFNNTVFNNTLNNKLTNNPQMFDCWLEVIHTNIDYNIIFANSPDKDLVDNIVSILADLLSSDIQTYKVNQKETSMGVIKGNLLKANMSHINYTLNILKTYPKEIKNMYSFIITTLYNAVNSLDIIYANRITTDNNNPIMGA